MSGMATGGRRMDWMDDLDRARCAPRSLVLLLGAAMSIGFAPSCKPENETGAKSAGRGSPGAATLPPLNTAGLVKFDQAALSAACLAANLPAPPDLSTLEGELARVLYDDIRQVLERKDAESYARVGHVYRAISADVEDVGRAVACYEQAKALDPQTFDWPYHLARAFALRGSTERAKLEFLKAAELKPDYAMAYGWMGEIELNENRPDKAKPHFEKFIQLRPDDAYGHVGLSIAQARTEDAQGAVQSLRRAVELQADDRQAHLLLAEAYARLGQEDDAKKHREAAALLRGERRTLERDPLERQLWLSLGPISAVRDRIQSMAASANVADAILLCEGFLAERPDDFDMMILLGKIQLDQGQVDEAFSVLQRASALRPQDATALTLLADGHLRAGRANEAVAAAERAIALDPGIATAQYLLAKSLLAAGRQEDAAGALRRAAELPVDVAEYWLSLGDLLFADQKPEEAVACFEKVLKLDPATPPAGPDALKAYTSLGRILSGQGKLDDAAKNFRGALSIKPGNDRALCGLGYVLDRQGKPDEALEHYRRAVAENPTSAFALGVYADALATRGRLDDALTHLRRATSLEPANPVFLAQLGNLLALRKDDQAAAAEFRKALELAPNESELRHALGVVVERAGDPAAAAKEWQRVLAEHPDHVNARLALMGQKYRARDYAAAKAIVSEGLKHAPESPALANTLAWILATCSDASLRNGREAVEWAEKACRGQQRPGAGFLDTLAAAYAEAGRFEDAVKTQREAIKLLTPAGAEEVRSFQERIALYESGKPFRQE